MKEKKNKNLPPLWMIKNINHGEESKELGFFYGSIIAYFPLEVACIFFLKINVLCEIILVLIVFALSVWLYIWLRNKVQCLEICRKTAIIKYEAAKSEEEKKEALLEMQELCIPEPTTKNRPRDFN